jgi:hypothetical protein
MMSVTASGTGPLSYQWRFDGDDIVGATASSLVLANVQPTNSGAYCVLVSNAYGQVISSKAVLVVTSPPAILSQPESQVSVVGASVAFSVTASGAPAPGYQWRLNGIDIAGGTTNPLVLASVELTDAGAYSVVVSNLAGSVTSAVAKLTVNPLPVCAVSPSGLVGWWRGNGNTLDDAGGDQGVAEGALAYAPAEAGQGFVFNGTDSDVRIPFSSSLDVGAGDGFTIEAWIMPGDVSVRPIVEWNMGGGDIPYGVYFWASQPASAGGGPGCLFANLVDISGQSHLISSSGGLLDTNAFQHVGLTYDKETGLGTLFLNGVKVAQRNLARLRPQTGYDLYFGARVAGGGRRSLVGTNGRNLCL